MRSSRKSSVGFAFSTLTLLLVSACGGGVNDGPKDPVSSPTVSLHGIVYGATDTSVPSGAGVSITMMGQMRALFDLIKKAPDFTQVVMDLGDGSPVHVLDTHTGR